MRADRPSQTATAFLRALHLVVDDQPYVFEDTVAIELLPWPQQHFLSRLGALPESWRRTFRQRRSALTRMRAQVLLRSRIAEDALAAARRDDIGRYLVLAAGLDRFALRQEGAASRLPVLELDHPATQRWKQDWMRSHRGGPPDDLELRAIDFERQSLADVLDRPARAQFVSWLGTSYYLTRPAIAATLTGLAALATTAGWRVTANWQAKAQNDCYLSGRRDGLRVPSFACLLALVIP